jgi:drug/metabolite transporter (DMT)-like permease
VTLVGALLISGLLEADAFGAHPMRGTIFGLLTTLCYAGFIIVLRVSNADVRRPAGPLFDATASATVVAILIAGSYGAVDLVPSWPAHGWLALLALSSQVVGWLLISVSLPRLPAALTSLMLLIQPVSAVALAALILHQYPSTLQIAGVVVILAGVLFAAGDGGSRSRAPVPAAAPRDGGAATSL